MAKIKKGDKVVITASDDELRDYNCSKEIQTGEEYKVRSVGENSYSLVTRGMGPWVLASFVEPVDDYSDKDWV